LFLLRTIVVVIVVIALFLYCTSKIYSSIQLFVRKCVINSVFSVQSWHYCSALEILLMHSTNA